MLLTRSMVTRSLKFTCLFVYLFASCYFLLSFISFLMSSFGSLISSFYIILYLFISLFSLFIHLQSHYVLRCGSDSCILIYQHVSLFCFSFRELIPSSFAVRTFENDGSEVIQEVDISYRTY